MMKVTRKQKGHKKKKKKRPTFLVKKILGVRIWEHNPPFSHRAFYSPNTNLAVHDELRNVTVVLGEV
ncbi:hypothetical protein E2C01_053114 [Portunus trituberculatus]|uniref:Uncharacterized protein n=1 Tax=Portunus trituberculatus TaxID=210409 RepID=A0A5B7GNC1_PORTR|nr:hypothetical protein [Portunus trituberculatus]